MTKEEAEQLEVEFERHEEVHDYLLNLAGSYFKGSNSEDQE